MLERHGPPAELQDLASIQSIQQNWRDYVGACIGDAIDSLKLSEESLQFVHRELAPPVLDLPIYWNAFPKSLMARHGRERALMVADELRWFQKEQRWARPQNEYCEWQVQRHASSHRIQRITFTCELPEYWQVMFGGTVAKVGGPSMTFAGDPEHVVRRYRERVRPDLRASDLCNPEGAYDPRNRWNTTDGIVHMSHPDNTLPAAVKLIADGTVLRERASERGGSPITMAEALCCAFEGVDPCRASDLTVVGTVNALARNGARTALAEPFGIYIHHIDTRGWHLPGLDDPRACCRVKCGSPGQVLRLVVEAPAGSASSLHDLTIGGEALAHGGQIAECITMRTSVQVSLSEPVTIARHAPDGQGYLRTANPALLAIEPIGVRRLSGRIHAFTHP